MSIEENNLLISWKTTINNHLKQSEKFMSDVKTIGIYYEKVKQEIFEIGFNVFKLSSDLYFRENFHSDIIKSLLDPKENHQEKNKYLFLFIDLLNEIDSKNHINKFDFENATVIRERANIDILVIDEKSKKAIIIENKINNAADQQRQLPKYYNHIKSNYTVSAIVYLTLDTSKRPDKNDWTNEEISTIESILKIIPSYDRSNINLYKNWIVPCIIESKNSESLFILKQYGNLIRHLNTINMDTVSLQKFYNTLQAEENHKTSISIRNMLNDLPEYLAIRIEDRYKNKCYPFKNIWRYQKRDTVFDGFVLSDIYIKMDIWCSENGYEIHFWNRDNLDFDVKEYFVDIRSFKDFSYHADKKHSIIKTFNFNEEEKLFHFVDTLLDELKDLQNITNTNG